jgi:hypothetical protein
MGYRKPPLLLIGVLPALYGALVISFIAFVTFGSDLYVGAPYSPDFAQLSQFIAAAPFVVMITSLFGLLAVWPVAIVAAQGAAWLIRHGWPQRDWSVWLLMGALTGGPALFAYSFLLGLGHAMLGPLLLNGAILGLVCAALVRKFAGPQVSDAAAFADLEGPDDRG